MGSDRGGCCPRGGLAVRAEQAVHPRRRIVEAILYVDRTGCAWRYLPTEYPPWRTVYGYFTAWRADGSLDRLHDALREQVRAAAGRSPAPSAAVIDSQSVRAADTVARSSRGWDNAKKVNGRKRHIAVDVTGLLLAIVVTPASVQDRDGARPLLWQLRAEHRGIRLAWADAGYAGKLVAWAAAIGLVIEVVRKRDAARLQGAAPPLGRRAHLRLDQQAPPLRPRLRAPARTSRSHGQMGDDRAHGPQARPPAPASAASPRAALAVTLATAA